MFLFLARILLIWWIITILFRWLGRLSAPENSKTSPPGSTKSDKDIDFVHSGTIEDADFEEIEDR